MPIHDVNSYFRIGEFVHRKSGHALLIDGYLAVTPGTTLNGKISYPIWSAMYPEFIVGNDIVFPADVAGMFLRNAGGAATTEGSIQGDATAMPNSGFSTSANGQHNHGAPSPANDGYDAVANFLSPGGDDAFATQGGGVTSDAGSHSHSITGGDSETRPVNRAYQLYTLVDTYRGGA